MRPFQTTRPKWSIKALTLCALALQTSAHSSFDAREATIDSVHEAIFNKSVSCRSVVSSFLTRIEAFNPIINAITSLNPDALNIADEKDQALAAGNRTGSLFCIPILLKDNYDAVGMNTTGASLDLAGNRPTIDAPSVKAFKDQDAIILGKANMHEMALEGLTVSSLGGQTLNPYDLTRTPGGSSGGTGAAVAMSFSVFGTGTDTVNSLRSPASANGLVSLRPTRGLISRAGVMPISHTQDSVGPIARNIQDLALALNVMSSVGVDSADNSTESTPSILFGKDYAAETLGGTLEGLRLGVLNGFFNRTDSSETTPVNDAMEDMFVFLKSEGVEIVNVTEPVYNVTALAKLDVQTMEFQEMMNDYLSEPNFDGKRTASFKELYSSGQFLVIPGQYSFMDTALASSTANSSYTEAQQGIQNLTAALKSTFSTNKLDAVIYPEQKNLVVKIGSASQAGRNGALACLTGVPVVTVPAGLSPSTDNSPQGIPIGMEILGLHFTEDKLLNIASQITQLHPMRKPPSLGNKCVSCNEYSSSVPVITPNRNNISPTYPIGVI